MNSLLEYAIDFPELILPFIHYNFISAILAGIALLCLLHRRKVGIYLLDFACYQPPDAHRLPMATFLEHVSLDDQFDPDSVAFQIKILEKSGFSAETSVPPSLLRLPIKKTLPLTLEEAKTVMFAVVSDLLKKKNINPKSIDILICNGSMFSPTPSMSSMIINKFKMRSNIMSFNLSGMGCSAGIAAVSLAKDLLTVHRNSLALIVSTEMLTPNWYTGKNRSMLLTNCLFRVGGAAILMSSRDQDKKLAKYTLHHIVRTNNARDDESYFSVFQDADTEGEIGVSISKNIIVAAGNALKANMASLGPMVLPFSELLRYMMSLIGLKLQLIRSKNIYRPDFKRAFDHLCIHAGGKAVIQAIEKSLGLSKEDVEASNMTLYRFGNTSSSSIWYELSYLQGKGRIKQDDRVCQIAFGSGFKCASAVWKCINNVKDNNIGNAWSDRIHLYPINVPHLIRID
ncbi:FAE1/Type III polyketide synthase-like protein [Dillenia turbinata]|uniref:3-ketoacyl-CoA synthase n=1 Tax=Dillenia turbinata TaxID=194707 RepID=A0AAN8V878_9MAGN